MPDLIAIVSKGIFEQDARKDGKVLGPGELWPSDRYTSKNKALASLAQGGRLVLVTVRPPNERLWLVAILEDLSFRADAWIAKAPNTIAIADISPLRKTLRFASGKGLSQEKGALGMSLQTPRALAPEDMNDILAATAAAKPEDVTAVLPANASPALVALAADLAKSKDNELLRERLARRLVAEGAASGASSLLAKWKHLNEHDGKGLPCLCKRCIAGAPAEHVASGIQFARDFVLKQGRVLHFWAPREVLAGGAEVFNSVRASLARRLAALAKERKQRARRGAEERSLARAKAREKARTRAR